MPVVVSKGRQWPPTPVLLPGKSHGRRSLVGCSPWGRKESDTTEQLHFHFSLSCIGEGNGNPLQCSCLENPRDGGAWWAAVYGVAQSRTRLKWLSKLIYNNIKYNKTKTRKLILVQWMFYAILSHRQPFTNSFLIRSVLLSKMVAENVVAIESPCGYFSRLLQSLIYKCSWCCCC